MSVASVAATVSAPATRAGLCPHASAVAFPAAVTNVTPAAMARRTASSSDRLAAPPRLRFATAGLLALAVTHSTPAMTPDVVPAPRQSSTRTGTSRTALATPWVAPPSVPATWVPWPLQSVVPRPSLTTL